MLNEIKDIKSKGYQNVWITDENFTFNLIRAKRLLKKILQSGLHDDLRFFISSWVNIDEEFLDLAKQCNIKIISFGIESGNKEILRFYRKNINIDEVPSIIRYANSLGIFTVGNFIIGAPMESESTITETFDLIKECEFDQINIKNLDYMIGSTLYEALDDKLKTDDHVFACLENGLNVFPLDEIKRIKDTFQSEYYNLHRSVIEKKIHLYIISLDYIADAQYEMGLLNEEKEDEAYYKDMNKNNHDESETDFNDLYDILFLKNNDFYKIFNVQTEQIENIMEDKEVMERHKLLEYVTVSEKYRGERFLFGESELYQDGILLNFNPQCIIPLGVGYVKANLTADSRLELNISRHELNNNKDVIRKWNKQVGYEIQRKVAENCINVLKKNNIDFEIHDLLSEREESFLKEKNFFAEKSFLTMRNVLNELLR